MIKNEFIEAIAPIIKRVASEFNICVVSPIIAQACLESTYGSSYKAKHHNYFGLKYRSNRVNCHNGYFTDTSSEQLADGSYVPTTDDWYSFDSMESGVRGYFEFISISRYSNLIGVSSPKRYLELIREDGYATSLDYVENVYNTLKSNNLERFDKIGDEVIMKYGSLNKPLECMQTNSTCYKGTRKMPIKGVLFHSTGCNNPNLKRYVQPSDGVSDYDEMIKLLGKNTANNDWNHIDREAGLNAWIGKLADGTVATIQTMPWNFRPWGCGSGRYGSCNDGWIQFEICEDDLNSEDYFNKVYNEAVELTAYLCKLYGLNPNGSVNVNRVSVPVITCHADSHKLGFGSNHADVNHWFPRYGKSMETVRDDVAKLLAGSSSNGVSSTEPTKPSLPSSPVDTIKYYVQVGAFKLKLNAERRMNELLSNKFDAILKKSGDLYIVQSGAFANKANALSLVDKIKSCGIEACISTNAGDLVSTTDSANNSKPVKPVKSVEELAREVLNNKWGKGAERKQRLSEAGYDYNLVQGKVNELVNNSNQPTSTPKKSVEELAREVWRGKWGNGQERKNRLTKEGYDYNAVQYMINKLYG